MERIAADKTGTRGSTRQTGRLPSEPERIYFIDMARFLAMALVFYGHFVERIMYLENTTAAAQYKFIYSFHMVLFFILAGYVARGKELAIPFGTFLKHRMRSRLLPFVFFTIVFMGLAAVFPGDFFHLKLPSLNGYTEGLLNTIFGIPFFCVPSWFILIIFSVEILHYGAFRFIRSNFQTALAIVAFYSVGYWFNWTFDIFNPIRGRTIGWNYLFIHEAVTMYAFYLIGNFLRRKRFLEEGTVAWPALLAAATALFLFVLLTYRLNRGLFSFTPTDAVVILFSSHGHFLWFPLTAIAGALMILVLGRLLPAPRTVIWMGQNTLILMCLNGIFYHYINPPMARWAVARLPGTPLSILAVSSAVTLASLALCIPLIHFFNRWVPQLVGKPQSSGKTLSYRPRKALP